MADNMTKEVAMESLTKLVGRTEDLMKLYDQMGSKYHDMVQTLKFNGPSKAAQHASAILKDNYEAKILDVCAGSGMAGVELKKLGYTNLHAVDGSSELLEVAKTLDCYKQCVCQFIGAGEPMPFDTDSFDMAVLSGAMAENHMPLSGIDDIIRVVRPGGYIVNVFRDEARQAKIYKGQFDAYMSRLEEEKKWKLVLEEDVPDFYTEIRVPGKVLVHQVL